MLVRLTESFRNVESSACSQSIHIPVCHSHISCLLSSLVLSSVTGFLCPAPKSHSNSQKNTYLPLPISSLWNTYLPRANPIFPQGFMYEPPLRWNLCLLNWGGPSWAVTVTLSLGLSEWLSNTGHVASDSREKEDKMLCSFVLWLMVATPREFILISGLFLVPRRRI